MGCEVGRWPAVYEKWFQKRQRSLLPLWVGRTGPCVRAEQHVTYQVISLQMTADHPFSREMSESRLSEDCNAVRNQHTQIMKMMFK